MKGILTAAQLSGTEEKGKASHAAPGSSITFDTKDDTTKKEGVRPRQSMHQLESVYKEADRHPQRTTQ